MVKRLEIMVGGGVDSFDCNQVSPNLTCKNEILNYLKSEEIIIASHYGKYMDEGSRDQYIPRNSILHITLIEDNRR